MLIIFVELRPLPARRRADVLAVLLVVVGDIVPIWDAGEPSRPLEVSILRVRGAQQSPRRFLAAFLGHWLEIEKEILLNIY